MTAPEYIAVDVAAVNAHIAQLLVTYPELADDETLLADMLEGETDLYKIASRVVAARTEAESMVAAIKEREADLSARKARFGRKSDAMKSLLKSLMDNAGQEKLTLPEATVSITKGRESVVVLDADQLPQGYFATIRQPDKKAIGDALKAGESIPGAALTFGEAGLTIRTK